MRCSLCGYRIVGKNHKKGEHHLRAVNSGGRVVRVSKAQRKKK